MKKLAVLVGLLAALVSPVLAEPVFVSSTTASADTAKTIRTGRFEIYKIIVSSAGAAGSSVSITNGGTKIIDLDASANRDVEYKVAGSSNIVYTTAGSPAPGVQILWSPTFQHDPIYSVSHSTGIWTTKNLWTGRGLLKKIIVSKPAASVVTVYDSNATASRAIANIDGATFSDNTYDVQISSGLTFTSTGAAGITFIYKRNYP